MRRIIKANQFGQDTPAAQLAFGRPAPENGDRQELHLRGLAPDWSLNLGIEAWFSMRVQTALANSVSVADAYVEEHKQVIRGDILAMADDLNRASPLVQGDQKRIEARIEAFNVFNHTNFQTANGNRSSTAFGTITSAFPARQLQLGVKFYF